MLDKTHDPSATSWVRSANIENNDFPIQNLPHGVFETPDTNARGGVRIGDSVFDIDKALELNLFSDDIVPIATAAAKQDLSDFMGLGNEANKQLRHALFELLLSTGDAAVEAQKNKSSLLIAVADVTMHMPTKVPSFIDFMSSIYHTTTGRKSRPERPLHEPMMHLPVGYNSRASTLTVSGVDYHRPWGQTQNDGEPVTFRPSQKLDFEVEFGAIVGKEIPLDSPIHIDQAEDHIFGYMIVNDWSARDIQLYEMRLGPFLGKSYRSSISPWIVTTHALQPFKAVAKPRGEDEIPYPAHMITEKHAAEGGLNIALEGLIQSKKMKEQNIEPLPIVRTHLKHLAWTMGQMLTHVVSNGCNADTGDIYSSGTVSGPEEIEAACLIEQTFGHLAFDLPTGEQRVWLEDGDTFSITAKATQEGYRSIGFGECSATILPAAEKWF